MSAHTPGPWHRNVQPATKYNTVWAGHNKHVARVVIDGGLSDEEIEANICLITAAPELLKALQDAVDYLKGSATRTVNTDNAAAEKARAAIAKAAGSST